MIRTSRSGRLVVLVLTLVAAAFVYGVPAQAAPPGPTQMFMGFHGSSDHAGQTLNVFVGVRPADHGPEYPTGTVTFSVGDGNPITLDPNYLSADTDFVIPSDSAFTVTAHFTGTNGWGDTDASATFTPLTRKLLVAEPTILRTGPGARLTLNFETHVTNSYGAGIPGQLIYFSLLGPLPDNLGHKTPYLQVCRAYTDANGLAKCNATAAVAAVVSILTAGGYASLWEPDVPGYDWVNLPVIIRG